MEATPASQATPGGPAGVPATERVLSADFVRVTVANFFFFMNFASFFLLPLHVRALGGSEQMIGLVMGVGGLAGLVSVFGIGTLLDRLGRRIFLRAGLGTMALASAGFVLVDRVGPTLFVLRVVQGLAFAAGFNAAATLAIELAPPARRAAALGMFGVSTLATHALAPTLGEQIVRAGGFATLFPVAAAFSLVGLGVAWSLPEPALHPSHGRGRFHASPELPFAIATVACCGMAFGSVITFVPTFVRDAGLGPVSTFFLCYTATAILTRLGAGDLGDTLGRRAVIRPALALLGVSIAALAWVRSTLALAGAGLLFGTAQGLVYPTLNAFTVDQAEEGQLGRTQSLYNGAFNLGVTLGAFAFGPVVHVFGHRRMFLCAAAVAGVALAVFSLGTRQPARARPAQ